MNNTLWDVDFVIVYLNLFIYLLLLLIVNCYFIIKFIRIESLINTTYILVNMYLKIHNIKIIDRLKLTISLKEYEEYEYL